MKQQVKGDGRTDHLGHVAGGDRDLRHNPQDPACPRPGAFAAELRQISLGSHAELEGKTLQENGHQVRGHDHKQQRVAELRPAGDVGGPVSRVHVAYGDQETRPYEAQQPPPIEAGRRDLYARVDLGKRWLEDCGGAGDLCGHGSGKGVTCLDFEYAIGIVNCS